MDNLTRTLLILQVGVCAVLIVSILLQNRAEGLGKMFGGGGEVFRTKRGKFLYYFTIFLIVVLIFLSLAILKYIG